MISDAFWTAVFMFGGLVSCKHYRDDNPDKWEFSPDKSLTWMKEALYLAGYCFICEFESTIHFSDSIFMKKGCNQWRITLLNENRDERLCLNSLWQHLLMDFPWTLCLVDLQLKIELEGMWTVEWVCGHCHRCIWGQEVQQRIRDATWHEHTETGCTRHHQGISSWHPKIHM